MRFGFRITKLYKKLRVTKMLGQCVDWNEKGIITRFQLQMMKRETECERIFSASKPVNYVKYAYVTNG